MFIGFTAVWIRFLKYSNVFITDKKLKNTVLFLKKIIFPFVISSLH